MNFNKFTNTAIESAFAGSKVLMKYFNNIKTAFNSQCEGYIVKPIDLDKLTAKIKELKLID